MAQPINIYFVRHGQSEGNVNPDLYAYKADHAIRLTEVGIRQAWDAGEFLVDHFTERLAREGKKKFGKIRVWHSPFYRARETAYHLLKPLGRAFDSSSSMLSYRESFLIFEQDIGYYKSDNENFAKDYPVVASDYALRRQGHGGCFAQIPFGERRIDTVIRTKPFFGTILRDAKKHNIRNIVVVSHGATVRAMTMGWMHYVPEWFDAEKNPGNGWIRHIQGNSKKGYCDNGYIHGDGAPLGDPLGTQKVLDRGSDVFMLKPQRSNTIVPLGVRVLDPFGDGPSL